MGMLTLLRQLSRVQRPRLLRQQLLSHRGAAGVAYISKSLVCPCVLHPQGTHPCAEQHWLCHALFPVMCTATCPSFSLSGACCVHSVLLLLFFLTYFQMSESCRCSHP